jgi:hypothetical protein
MDLAWLYALPVWLFGAIGVLYRDVSGYPEPLRGLLPAVR